MSARFVPIGIWIVCWENHENVVDLHNTSILMMSSSEYLVFNQSSFTKYASSWPDTKYLYLRKPFLKMKFFSNNNYSSVSCKVCFYKV